MSSSSDRGLRDRLRWLVWNDAERRPRAPWRFVIVAVLVLSALIVAGVGVGIVALVMGLGTGKSPGPLLRVLGLTGTYTVVVGALLFGAWLVDRREVGDLGVRMDRAWWADFGFGALLGVVMATLVAGLELAAGWARITGTLVSTDGQFAAAPTPPALAVALAAVAFVAVAVGEELLVRGYLMTNLAEGLNGLGPVDADRALVLSGLLTGVLFGLLHASNPNATAVSVVNIALVGVFFAATYVLTERLGIAVGLHLTWNWSVGSLYGLPVSGLTTGGAIIAIEERGPDWATGGAFGPEAGVVVLIALVVATVLLVLWVRRQYGGLAIRDSVAVPALRIDPTADADGEPSDGSSVGGSADTANRDG